MMVLRNEFSVGNLAKLHQSPLIHVHNYFECLHRTIITTKEELTTMHLQNREFDPPFLHNENCDIDIVRNVARVLFSVREHMVLQHQLKSLPEDHKENYRIGLPIHLRDVAQEKKEYIFDWFKVRGIPQVTQKGKDWVFQLFNAKVLTVCGWGDDEVIVVRYVFPALKFGNPLFGVIHQHYGIQGLIELKCKLYDLSTTRSACDSLETEMMKRTMDYVGQYCF